ncbi:hypothetical protein KKH56_07495 [bacterium]|nr:hypothetical protein [bacterium]
MMKNKSKREHKMRIKKIWLLTSIFFFSANGYCGLQYEVELARKFCPSLQLHSGDQGVAPKPVEVCPLRLTTIAGIQGSELIFRPELLVVEKDMSPNTALYSESFGSEQSKEKKTKKGRITGTVVGAGIGGGLGYVLYALSHVGTGLGGVDEEPSPLIIIIPAVIGGVIGYAIGDYYDEK